VWLVAVVAILIAGCDDVKKLTEQPVTTISPGAVEANAEVDFVIDGDTIDVLIDGTEERVRLIGIDTPETKKPNTPIECFGPEATSFTTSLLPVGTPVRLERDIVNRDHFGRLLAYVYRAGDGIFVNYEVLRQGFGTPLSIEPNTTHIELFVDAARTAEASDVGIWSVCTDSAG
jgi:micrococcal nuclease